MGQHVRAVGQRHRPLRPLLDEQDREAALANLLQRPEDHVDKLRGEPERGLVEEQHVRIRNEGPRDRQLLLLPAGERAGLAAGNSSYARVSAPSRFPLLRPARPSLRFSSTLSSAKMRRPSGTSATPARATCSGRRPTRERPCNRTSPAAAGTRPMIACSVEDLPAPFGPINPTISPLSTVSDKPRTAWTAP